MRLRKKIKKFIYNQYWSSKRKISDAIYWLKCHLLSSHRFHMLDLRQPHPRGHFDHYRYGWIDSDDQLLLASFKILENFVVNEMDNFYRPTDEDIQEMPSNRGQQAAYDEIMALYNWWKTNRHIEIENFESLDFLERREAIRKREDEMLIRLINVRHHMWT